MTKRLENSNGGSSLALILWLVHPPRLRTLGILLHKLQDQAPSSCPSGDTGLSLRGGTSIARGPHVSQEGHFSVN